MDAKTFTSFVLIYAALTMVGGESIALTHPGRHEASQHTEAEKHVPMTKGRYVHESVVTSHAFDPRLPIYYEVKVL